MGVPRNPRNPPGSATATAENGVVSRARPSGERRSDDYCQHSVDNAGMLARPIRLQYLPIIALMRFNSVRTTFVGEPSRTRGPPPVAQACEISNIAKDFKISREISRDFQISKEISRFPERFLGFRRDFQISGEILGFQESS